MKIRANHQQGQYRTELFDELLSRLLVSMYAGSRIERDIIFPKGEEGITQGATSIDFAIYKPDGKIVLIESKAPYTSSAVSVVERTIRSFRDGIKQFNGLGQIDSIILSLASDIPSRALKNIEFTKRFFEQQKLSFEIWDSKKLTNLFYSHLKVKLNELTIPALEKALGISTEVPSSPSEVSHQTLSPLLTQQSEIIVLSADFCSYSKFVHASSSDKDLITSIMARFYRGLRKIIRQHGGILDKFIGDGLLAYWLPEDNVSERLRDCVKGIIGISVKLAIEWQFQIDLSVEPKGMRVGAAIGPLLFIPENPDRTGTIHAIGESINIAARLHSIADPNTFVISNRLKSKYFDDDSFVELPPALLKNIGEVLAWKMEVAQGAKKE